MRKHRQKNLDWDIIRSKSQNGVQGCYINLKWNEKVGGMKILHMNTPARLPRSNAVFWSGARVWISEKKSTRKYKYRILCSLKASIKRYCYEGHDIRTAEDIHTALKERPVSGTTASVCTIEEQNKTLDINKINDYSKLHNFKFTETGLRVWKAFDIGTGKLLSLKDLINFPQAATNLKEEIHAFPTNARKFTSKKVAEQTSQKKYECPDPTWDREKKKYLV